jgi:hypothetical protein
VHCHIWLCKALLGSQPSPWPHSPKCKVKQLQLKRGKQVGYQTEYTANLSSHPVFASVSKAGSHTPPCPTGTYAQVTIKVAFATLLSSALYDPGLVAWKELGWKLSTAFIAAFRTLAPPSLSTGSTIWLALVKGLSHSRYFNVSKWPAHLLVAFSATGIASNYANQRSSNPVSLPVLHTNVNLMEQSL